LGFHTPALSEVVPSPHLATLLRLLQPLRFAVGYRPSFATMRVLVAGWVLTQAPMHCVTEALVVTDVARRRHWQAFHRFFSRGTWTPDALGLVVLRLVRRLGAASPLRLVLEDTLCAKKGPAVFGLGSHLDAVRSTKKRKAFAFGHSWVVLAVVIAPPFASRPWALPVLFRLYRTEATCPPEAFRKRTELARALLERLLAALPDEPVEVSADEAYGNHTVVGGLPARVTWVGAMRPDAALTAPLAARAATGRPRKRGAPLPTPKELAADARALAAAVHHARRARAHSPVQDDDGRLVAGLRHVARTRHRGQDRRGRRALSRLLLHRCDAVGESNPA
jgi:DDE superfamily endonuclease